MFKNQWVYLSRWYAKLGLVIEGDGLKIHEFYNGREYTWQKNVKPYYNVYVWINIGHDYVILKEFQIISQMKNNKNTDCNILEMFLNILQSLDPFQLVSHVSIFFKINCANNLKTCNINFFWTLNIKNQAVILLMMIFVSVIASICDQVKLSTHYNMMMQELLWIWSLLLNDLIINI